jgi:hypothetical protein
MAINTPEELNELVVRVAAAQRKFAEYTRYFLQHTVKSTDC